MTPDWIDRLKLHAIDQDAAPAAASIASVPLPAEGHALVNFASLRAQVVPIAWHAGPDGPGLPRQVLLLGVGDAGATASLAPAKSVEVVEAASPVAAPEGAASASGPRWSVKVTEEKKLGLSMNEFNELVIEHDGRLVGMRMGLAMAEGGHHWWQWVQVERLWTGPVCTAIRAAGYVAVNEIAEGEIFDSGKYNCGTWLHRHNWLHVEVYAQLFVNGLVRVTARHVNNRFFDQGRDLEGFVPVIAFRPASPATQTPALALDGTKTCFALGTGAGAVQLDIDRSCDLLSAAHPGKLYRDGGLTVFQPYEGAEFLLGEGAPDERWNVRAEQKRMWKGMARSFAFDLSFAPAPLRTRRYLPPWGWQAQSGALWPDGMVVARGEIDHVIDRMLTEKGANSRMSEAIGVKPYCSGRFFQVSSMWDGEQAHGWMRHAYRSMRKDLYDAAIHHAYAFADVGMDHADFTHQIVGMPKGSISLVLQRTLGMLAGYLETGDPYLLRCATSMADTAYSIDRSNWPRRSYGRDGAYIRSLTRLYDVTGEPLYLRRAGEACRRAAQTQRPNGSFTDQGATTGAHGHLQEIVKPWMNSILAEVFVDYLERAGHDAVVEASLRRTADWLLASLCEGEQGRYWPYQIEWGRNECDPTVAYAADKTPRKHPVGHSHLDYNARTLLWLSRRTGDARYVRAWMETYQTFYIRQKKIGGGYGEVKVPDNFPWHEAHLWGARLVGDRLTFDPMPGAIDIGREATLELYDGRKVRVKRTAAGVETIG